MSTAVRMRRRSALTVAMGTFVGAVAFLWPFVLVLAGRVFGPGFGFALGSTSLFASALLTGGVGPWMPYQMFGCAWVGMFAGLLPAARGKAEIALLAAYGATAGYFFGFMLNLSFWPFAVDPTSSIAFKSGLSLAEQWHRYLLF